MKARAMITTDERLTKNALAKISWDISILRGWSVQPGDGSVQYPFSLVSPNSKLLFRGTAQEIEEQKPDWFFSGQWPELFEELPTGSILSINKTEHADQKFGVSMCNCGLPTPVCQPGPNPAVAVCFAWLAWKVSLALPALIEVSNVSDQIH